MATLAMTLTPAEQAFHPPLAHSPKALVGTSVLFAPDLPASLRAFGGLGGVPSHAKGRVPSLLPGQRLQCRDRPTRPPPDTVQMCSRCAGEDEDEFSGSPRGGQVCRRAHIQGRGSKIRQVGDK